MCGIFIVALLVGIPGFLFWADRYEVPVSIVEGSVGPVTIGMSKDEVITAALIENSSRLLFPHDPGNDMSMLMSRTFPPRSEEEKLQYTKSDLWYWYFGRPPI